jgi:hypothetical protein
MDNKGSKTEAFSIQYWQGIIFLLKKGSFIIEGEKAEK